MGVHRSCPLIRGLYDARVIPKRCRETFPPRSVRGPKRGSSGNNRDISSRWLLIRRDNARGPSLRLCVAGKLRTNGAVCVAGISRQGEKARAFICLLAGPGINNAAIRYKNEKKGWRRGPTERRGQVWVGPESIGGTVLTPSRSFFRERKREW